MTTPEFLCANWDPDLSGCKKNGKFSCGNCFLVVVCNATRPPLFDPARAKSASFQYCGQECQKLHWTAHKKDCKSGLGKKSWVPGWKQENRQPTFMENVPVPQVIYNRCYLWGNAPAFDIVRLGANEGEDYARPLRLLFAGSLPLRSTCPISCVVI